MSSGQNKRLCSFVKCVLTRLGLGPVFLQLLGILYKYPKARIKIGKLVTNHISITRETRQGCPLFPILYATIAEPLAAALREYHGNKGIRLPGYELIISTYADDTLLYIQDPERHLSPILREVVRFGCMSGLCVNWSKSIIFPITPCTSQFEPEFPLQWSTEAVRYLGIRVHTDVEVVLKENYRAAMGRLEDEVEKWIKLPLSLMGTISLMKMVVLPCLLLLFTNIPMVLPKVFFHRLTSLMIRLAWAGKQARTSCYLRRKDLIYLGSYGALHVNDVSSKRMVYMVLNQLGENPETPKCVLDNRGPTQ